MSGGHDDRPDDPAFEAQLKARLAARADDVPGATRERLAAMRRQAVAEFESRHAGAAGARWFESPWVPRGALAAAAATVVLAAGLLLFAGNGSVPMMPDADDPEFAAAQDLEVLEELEFLAWLDEETPGAG